MYSGLVVQISCFVKRVSHAHEQDIQTDMMTCNIDIIDIITLTRYAVTIIFRV